MPHEGVLSPVLPQLYFNDLSNCFECINILFYADDTTLFVESDTINDLYTFGIKAVVIYDDWIHCSTLTLNKSKKYM